MFPPSLDIACRVVVSICDDEDRRAPEEIIRSMGGQFCGTFDRMKKLYVFEHDDSSLLLTPEGAAEILSEDTQPRFIQRVLD